MNVITLHARQRARERLGFLTPGEFEEVIKRVERQRPRQQVPRWMDPRKRYGPAVIGVVCVKVWQPWERRTGWRRERLVGFPVVLRGDQQYTLTTCILGPLTGRERLAVQ